MSFGLLDRWEVAVLTPISVGDAEHVRTLSVAIGLIDDGSIFGDLVRTYFSKDLFDPDLVRRRYVSNAGVRVNDPCFVIVRIHGDRRLVRVAIQTGVNHPVATDLVPRDDV